MKKSDALAQTMALRLRLHLPADADVAWQARRALERLLAAWPASYLARLATTDGLCLVVHQGETALSVDPARQAAGCRLTLFFSLDHLLTGAEPLWPATAALAMAVLADAAAHGGPSAAVIRSEFERRLETARGLSYAWAEADEAAAASYLSLACSAYLADRAALAGQDPQAYRLLRSTLFSEGFWRSLAGAQRGAADRG